MNIYISIALSEHIKRSYTDRIALPSSCVRKRIFALSHTYTRSRTSHLSQIPLVYFLWVAFNKSRKRTFASWGYDARNIDSDTSIFRTRSLSSHGVRGNGPRSHTGKLWFIRANIVSLIRTYTTLAIDETA